MFGRPFGEPFATHYEADLISNTIVKSIGVRSYNPVSGSFDIDDNGNFEPGSVGANKLAIEIKTSYPNALSGYGLILGDLPGSSAGIELKIRKICNSISEIEVNSLIVEKNNSKLYITIEFTDKTNSNKYTFRI
jgi:hypothetical protein